jgi:hypothetical protein
MSIRKRPGIVTRTQKKALEALGPLEDDGESEPLEKLLSGEVDGSRDASGYNNTVRLVYLLVKKILKGVPPSGVSRQAGLG